MLLRFFQRLSGRQVLLLAALAIVWFQGALVLSGLYPSHVRAQGGPAIEETPFMDAAEASARLTSINDNSHQWSTMALLGADALNVVFLFLALGAAGVWAARAANFPPFVQQAASVLPLLFALGDMAENVLILSAILPPYDVLPKAAGVIGYATGLKHVFFGASALLLVAGLFVAVARLLLSRRAGG